jgi:hypothetical protein
MDRMSCSKHGSFFRNGTAEPEEESPMYGKFSPMLRYDPKDKNKLIVTGPLVAQTAGDLIVAVKITAELWQDPDHKVQCSTNGDRFCPSALPGTTWTMDASTDLHGAVNAHARAFDEHNNVVAEWFQPAAAGDPQIEILP